MPLRCASWAFGRTLLVSLASAGALHAAGTVSIERCRASATSFMARLQGGHTMPLGWQDARVGEVSVLGPAWYLCTVMRGKEAAGYVVLAERGERMAPVMFSGSALPKDLAATLSIPEAGGLAEVPHELPEKPTTLLIAPIDEMTTIGSTRVTTTPVAAGLAAVLRAIQGSAESVPPLFIERMCPDEYWRKVVPLLERAGMKPVPGLVTANGYLPDKHSLDRHGKYQEQRLAVLRNPDLYQEHEGPAGLKGYTCKDSVKMFDAYTGLLKSHLQDRISPYERARVLADESTDAEGLGISSSRGMRVGFILERRYLNGAESVENALDVFARTRGFAVVHQRKAISQISGKDLPCLLLGPRSEAAVLISLKGDSGWGLVCCPETVVPIQREVSRRLLPFSPGSTTRPGQSAPSTQPKKLVLLEDPRAALPESLDHGAHIVALGALETSWQALVLGAWTPAENWDLE